MSIGVCNSRRFCVSASETEYYKIIDCQPSHGVSSHVDTQIAPVRVRGVSRMSATQRIRRANDETDPRRPETFISFTEGPVRSNQPCCWRWVNKFFFLVDLTEKVRPRFFIASVKNLFADIQASIRVTQPNFSVQVARKK